MSWSTEISLVQRSVNLGNLRDDHARSCGRHFPTGRPGSLGSELGGRTIPRPYWWSVRVGRGLLKSRLFRLCPLCNGAFRKWFDSEADGRWPVDPGAASRIQGWRIWYGSQDSRGKLAYTMGTVHAVRPALGSVDVAGHTRNSNGARTRSGRFGARLSASRFGQIDSAGRDKVMILPLHPKSLVDSVLPERGDTSSWS